MDESHPVQAYRDLIALLEENGYAIKETDFDTGPTPAEFSVGMQIVNKEHVRSVGRGD